MAITIPNTFVAGTKIEASPMNANFAEVANAVDKRGDTVTGNIAANAGVKFDGVDLSTIPNSSGTFDPLFAQVVIGTADTNGIRLDLETGTLAVREGDDSAYAPLITGLLTTSGNHVPASNDGGSLGISGTAWADAFLASGGVINWNAGDTTLTHSSGKLTLSGSGAGALDVKGAILPTANDGAALGASGTAWADLFLASGAVLNFNAGDVTVTHSSNTLAFAGAATGYTFADGPITNALGAVGTPSYTFTGDLNTGLWSPAADTVSVSVGGTERFTLTSTGLGIGVTAPGNIIDLANDAGTSIRASRYSSDTGGPSLILRKIRGTQASPSTIASGDSPGSLTFQAYGGTNYRTIAQISAFAPTYTSDTNMSGELRFYTTDATSFASEKLRLTGPGVLQPGANDGGALGTGSLAWSDLFLASGGVINFANGDVTITHSSDTLTFAGAASGYVFNNGVMTVSQAGTSKFGSDSGYVYIVTNSGGPAGWGSSVRGAYTAASPNNAGFEIGGDGTGTAGAWVSLGGSGRGDANKGKLRLYAQDATYGDIEGYAGGTTLKFSIKASDGHTYTDNGSVYSLSDLRYKSFIAPFTRGLAEIVQLAPALYQHHADTGVPEAAAPFVSLGAQDVESIIPEAVSIGHDGKYGLGTSPLLYAAINAIKELHSGITALEAKMTALEARLN